jgi:hypothetical protein
MKSVKPNALKAITTKARKQRSKVDISPLLYFEAILAKLILGFSDICQMAIGNSRREIKRSNTL